jgi:hypothetical protein
VGYGGINVTYESSKNECLCGCISGTKEGMGCEKLSPVRKFKKKKNSVQKSPEQSSSGDIIRVVINDHMHEPESNRPHRIIEGDQ